MSEYGSYEVDLVRNYFKERLNETQPRLVLYCFIHGSCPLSEYIQSWLRERFQSQTLVWSEHQTCCV